MAVERLVQPDSDKLANVDNPLDDWRHSEWLPPQGFFAELIP